MTFHGRRPQKSTTSRPGNVRVLNNSYVSSRDELAATRASLPIASPKKNVASDMIHSQARHSIDCITDPLWKWVCREIMRLMGPLSALTVLNGSLGAISPNEMSATLRCPTETMAQFVREYDFVILSTLKQYFPNLRELQID